MTPTNTIPSHRWLRAKRHFRSLTIAPRAARDADRAVLGESVPRRRSLCRGSTRSGATRLAG
jgi:hypothetical protein